MGSGDTSGGPLYPGPPPTGQDSRCSAQTWCRKGLAGGAAGSGNMRCRGLSCIQVWGPGQTPRGSRSTSGVLAHQQGTPEPPLLGRGSCGRVAGA